MEQISFKEKDPWTYYIAEYMVWSFRVICYCVNFFVFMGFRRAIPTSGLTFFVYDIVFLIYSIIGLSIVEWFFKNAYNPSYKELELTENEQVYRIEGERIILSCICFCVVTFILTIPAAYLVLDVQFSYIALGLFGGLWAGAFNLFGVILLVIQNKETGKRSSILCVIGGILLFLPLGYILSGIYVYLKSI